MKKITLPLCIVLLTGCTGNFQCDTPDITCINLLDREGFSTTVHSIDRLQQYAGIDFLAPQAYQRAMVIYQRDAQGDIASFITSYFPNGQVKQYLDVVNSRANGNYSEWHENGYLKLECTVVGGEADLTPEAMRNWLFDDTCQAWDACGNLVASIQYQMGALEGLSLYFYPDGTVKRRTPFSQNEAHGLDEIYRPDGSLRESNWYEKGIRHGAALHYWEGGEIASDELYDKGKLASGRYYDCQGKLIAQVDNGQGTRALFDDHTMRQLEEIKDGVAEGEVKRFDEAQRLSNMYHIKNGMRHGDELVYYPKGDMRPKLLVTWYEDKMHGLAKTWYDNGNLECQREMSHNMRNGVSSAWYSDGSLMLMEEYDHDKLVKGEYFRKGEQRAESRIVEGTGTATLYDSEGNLLQKVQYFHSHPLD